MRIALTVITCVLFLGNGFSQDSAIPTLSLDTNSIMIGEQVKLRVALEYRVDEEIGNILWPEIGDTLPSHIEVISRSAVDTSVLNKDDDPFLWIQKQELIITSFDTGYFPIEPLKFMVGDLEMETNPVLIQVKDPQVNVEEEFMDIVDIVEVEITFMDWLKENWGKVATATSLILALTLALILYRRRKKAIAPEPQAEPEPVIPPAQWALQRLTKLRSDKIWQSGRLKLYYSQLTDILREYLEGAYGINALEETSGQIIRDLKRLDLDPVKTSRISSVLKLADMVKFAKEKPIQQENDEALEEVIRFIQYTDSERVSEESKYKVG